MRDRHPTLSGKELRFLREELCERHQACLEDFDRARAALKSVEASIDMLDETVLARKRTNMLTDAAAKRAARERGDS